VAGVLVLSTLLVPWPEVAAALLLTAAALVAFWGLRTVPGADCGCFGLKNRVRPRTIVRAGLLAGLAAAAAVAGESWTAVFHHPAGLVATLAAGALVAWLSPELPHLVDRVGAVVRIRTRRTTAQIRRIRSSACERRAGPVEGTVARLQGSDLWRRARPFISADAPSDHWFEGCTRLVCYPAVYEGQSATAVFAVGLGLRQNAHTVAFVNEEEQRVLARPRRERRLVRARAVLAATVVVFLALPAAAGAHAYLIRTVPGRDAVVQREPASVNFFFTEPVEATFGVLRVYDSRGREVQSGLPFRPPGRNGLAIALPPGLANGTYRATYRVIAVDSHPTAGSFSFSIGSPSSGHLSRIPGLPGTGAVTSTLFWLDRLLGYAAMGLAVGALFFLLRAWRPALAGEAGGGERWIEASAAFNERLSRLVGIAVVAGLAASLLAVPLQGATAAETSLWNAFGGSVLSDVVNTRFGMLMLVRAAAWALLGGILAIAAGRGRFPALRPAELGATGNVLNRPVSPELIALTMIPIGSLLVSPALAGHARTQSPEALLFPSDVVHVTAMCLWLGGLVALVAAVPAAAGRLDPGERARLLLATLLRFSTVALACVIALAVTGTVQAVILLGSVSDLFETGYGRAVLAKILLLAVLIGLGASNRQRLIPALGRALTAADELLARLARNLRTEVALIAVVLGVVAMLVAFAPPVDTSRAHPRRAASRAPRRSAPRGCATRSIRRARA